MLEVLSLSKLSLITHSSPRIAIVYTHLTAHRGGNEDAHRQNLDDVKFIATGYCAGAGTSQTHTTLVDLGSLLAADLLLHYTCCLRHQVLGPCIPRDSQPARPRVDEGAYSCVMCLVGTDRSQEDELSPIIVYMKESYRGYTITNIRIDSTYSCLRAHTLSYRQVLF